MLKKRIASLVVFTTAMVFGFGSAGANETSIQRLAVIQNQTSTTESYYPSDLSEAIVSFKYRINETSEIHLNDEAMNELDAFNFYLSMKELKPYFVRRDFYVRSKDDGVVFSNTLNGNGYLLPIPNQGGDAFTLHFKSDNMVYYVVGDQEVLVPHIQWNGIAQLLNPFFSYDDRDFDYTVAMRPNGVTLSFDGGEHTTVLGSPLQMLLGIDNIVFGLKDQRVFVKTDDTQPTVYVDFNRMGDFFSGLAELLVQGQTFSFNLSTENMMIESVSHSDVLTSVDFFQSMGLNADLFGIDLTTLLRSLVSNDEFSPLIESQMVRMTLSPIGFGMESEELQEGMFMNIDGFSDMISGISDFFSTLTLKDYYFVLNTESGVVTNAVTKRIAFNVYDGKLHDETVTTDNPFLDLAGVAMLAAFMMPTDIEMTTVEPSRDTIFENIEYTDLEHDDWVRPFLSQLIKRNSTVLRNSGNFNGDLDISRAEAAKIVSNAFELDQIKLVDGEQYFIDTSMGSWQELEMARARYHGVLAGQERPHQGFFRIFMRPDEPVSRCEFMKISVGALCLKNPNLCGDAESLMTYDIPDMEDNNPFAKYVKRGYEKEALNYEGDAFRCNDQITRREAVKVISILSR